MKICHLKNFANFARKYLSQSLYNQVADPRLGLQLDYKETATQEFSCDPYEIMKNIFFLQNTHMRTLPMAASTADPQTKDLLHKSYKKTSLTASLL